MTIRLQLCGVNVERRSSTIEVEGKGSFAGRGGEKHRLSSNKKGIVAGKFASSDRALGKRIRHRQRGRNILILLTSEPRI